MYKMGAIRSRRTMRAHLDASCPAEASARRRPRAIPAKTQKGVVAGTPAGPHGPRAVEKLRQGKQNNVVTDSDHAGPASSRVAFVDSSTAHPFRRARRTSPYLGGSRDASSLHKFGALATYGTHIVSAGEIAIHNVSDNDVKSTIGQRASPHGPRGPHGPRCPHELRARAFPRV